MNYIVYRIVGSSSPAMETILTILYTGQSVTVPLLWRLYNYFVYRIVGNSSPSMETILTILYAGQLVTVPRLCSRLYSVSCRATSRGRLLNPPQPGVYQPACARNKTKPQILYFSLISRFKAQVRSIMEQSKITEEGVSLTLEYLKTEK